MDWLAWLWHPYNVMMVVLCGVHVVFFVGLVVSRKRQVRRLESHLEDILGPKFRRISQDPDRTVDEMIDGFFLDIQDVVSSKHGQGDARELAHRLLTKDESRKYLKRMSFETIYSCVRTGIEAWPLLGILGTVLGIALGFSAATAASRWADGQAAIDGPTTAPTLAAQPQTPAPQAPDSSPTGAIVRNFQLAIGSTILGLTFGVGFMLFNAWVEPGFERLMEHRKSVRDVVRSAKNVLFSMHEAGRGA